MDIVTQIFKEIFAPGRRRIVIAVLFIGAYVFLLLPEPLANNFFGLQAFNASFGQWIGPTAVVMTVLVVIELGIWGLSGWTNKRRSIKEFRQRKARLKYLTPMEKQKLKLYRHKSEIHGFDVDDEIVQGLVAKEILYEPLNSPRDGLNIYLKIYSKLYDYLSKNPNLLE